MIEGESPHHSSTPGANYHQCGDAVLQVGLCRQNADATVDVLREPLRFHGLVVLYSFRLESRHTYRSHRDRMAVQDASCAALQARATAAAPKLTRVQHPASTRNQNIKHRRNTSTETEKPTRFQRAHNRRTNKESAQNNLNRQRKRRRK